MPLDAIERGYEIVRTYSDAAKSAVTLKNRAGLKKLIEDVTLGVCDFDVVLVYDVCRWGRFQDVDEAAHYEFLCKSAGIPVEYCAEQFSNDVSVTSSAGSPDASAILIPAVNRGSRNLKTIRLRLSLGEIFSTSSAGQQLGAH
jgi:DNA invertase Pin-like site-specific DNA recombinase